MARNLRWMKDPKNYVLDFDGDLVRVNDVYSQWLIRWGTDFNLTNEIKKVDPLDFTFVQRLKNRTGDGQFGNRVTESPDLKSLVFVDDPLAVGKHSNDLVVTLPIRNSGISPDFDPNIEPDYVPHDDVNEETMVIVGIIDDSINLCHDRFRVGTSHSRIDFAWIQGAVNGGQKTVPFGKEVTRTEIEYAIQQFGDSEEALFHHLQLVGTDPSEYRPSPLKLRKSHGTHVADIAAGYGNEPDQKHKALNRRILGVQIPALVTQDTSGSMLISSVHSAARYIFGRALQMSKELNHPIPVVLNFSYGLANGSRDGFSYLELALRQLAFNYRRDTANLGAGSSLLGAPVERVLPAGNGHLSAGHAITLNQPENGNDVLQMNYRLQPDDMTSSYLEIWLPYRKDPEFEVAITPPGYPSAAETLRIPEDGLPPYWILTDDTADVDDDKITNVICRVAADVPSLSADQPFIQSIKAAQMDSDTTPLNKERYFRVLLAFAPTTNHVSNRKTAPHGVWRIKVSTPHTDYGISAWIPRGETSPGFPQRGRQAYFDDDAYVETKFDRYGDVAVQDSISPESSVRRNGTLSGIATNEELEAAYIDANGVPQKEPTDSFLDAIIVGANRADTQFSTLYSAAGRSGLGAPVLGPHVMTCGETSRVLDNLLAAGSRSGSTVAQNGTSVAAPRIARLLADMISEIPAQERKNFDSKYQLSIMGISPQRPSPINPVEEANRPEIRAERLRYGGKLLDTHEDLKLNQNRGVLNKTM